MNPEYKGVKLPQPTKYVYVIVSRDNSEVYARNLTFEQAEHFINARPDLAPFEVYGGVKCDIKDIPVVRRKIVLAS